MFKHILVPIDGSDLSREVVTKAASFAREAGAQLTLLFARPAHQAYIAGHGALYQRMDEAEFDRLSESRAQDVLGAAGQLLAVQQVPYSTLAIASDSPYEAIIKGAEERGCDVIFMASHGRKGISGLLLGSETVKVLTHSKVPVLVYR